MTSAAPKTETNHAFWIVAQARRGVPCAFGSPGTGKTAICEAGSRKLGREYFQMLLSCKLPEDIEGNPVIGKVTINGKSYDVVKKVMEETMAHAMYGHSFVHLDEANHASPQTWAAAQEIWLNRPPKSAIVAATCNPESIATDGFALSAPVVNRMCILKWEDDHDAWVKGMSAGAFDEPSFPVLPADWEETIPKYMAYMGKFASTHEQHFTEGCVPVKDEDKVKPWRSRRSWYNGACNLAACESVGASQALAAKILTGFVGQGPAVEFMTWFKTNGLPTSKELFEDHSLLKLVGQFDVNVSIVKGVASYASRIIEDANDHDKGALFERGLDFCEAVFAQRKEIGVMAVGSFVKLKPEGYRLKSRSSELYKMASTG